MTKRWIVTGNKGTGKTTFCRQLRIKAGTAGWNVAGVISLPRYEDGVKTGIELLDLRSGTSRMLASTRPEELEGFHLCNWSFSNAALDWGNEALRSAAPCDLLIVDEIGPLEIKKGRGLTAYFQAIESASCRLAVVSIRPALLERFQTSWKDSHPIEISSPGQARVLADNLFDEEGNFCEIPLGAL